MKQVDQWICWAESHKGEAIPVDPNEYRKALHRYRPSDYANQNLWLQYDEAIEFANNREAIDGIGFVTIGKDISYIDFDNCVNPDTCEIDPEIYSIINRIDSYIELSGSKRGLHVFCRGNSPSYGWTPESQDYDISVFDGSWVAVTESHLEGYPRSVQGKPSDLDRICERFNIDTHGGW